ncbi:putative mitochondrial/chloroplast ribosomal protein L45 [Ostreococcus tauri]|uniref:Large ribosomal subunit protein mL45 n=1 Tax=Ostreococcus tauri TaxID=70448 RepID=A0A1Y5IC13_OSTTA|nr:putative mitochondrial/chloroplast ribosomal protein L45 [Ostreococcus tauri]
MSTTRARLFERAASALSTRRSTHVNVTRDVIHVIPTRAYARPTLKGVNPTPSAASGARSGIRLNRTSSNVIAEPYAGPLRRPTIVQALTTSLGWRYVVDSALGKAKDAYALSKCAKEIKGFTLDGFKAEAKQLYRMINATSASTSGTRALSHETRHATTDKMQSDLKRERKARELGGWGAIDWSLEDIEECQVVRGRLIMANPNDTSGAGFVQLTTRFRSRQRFAAYDGKGRLVSGDPDEVLDVEDFWVFEHGLKIPNSRWRLAGRLHVPNSASGSAAQATQSEK